MPDFKKSFLFQISYKSLDEVILHEYGTITVIQEDRDLEVLGDPKCHPRVLSMLMAMLHKTAIGLEHGYIEQPRFEALYLIEQMNWDSENLPTNKLALTLRLICRFEEVERGKYKPVSP